MARQKLCFEHVVIDDHPPGGWHDILLLTDLTGNGLPDIIIGGKAGPPNLFWYENPGFSRHEIAEAPELEAGGVLIDISGNGKLDIVAGQQTGGRYLFWFEQPDDPREPWTPRIVEDRFEQYHDQAAGDVDGDGEFELIALSQRSGVLVYYDIPADPRISPWPRSCARIVADNLHQVEGLAVVDFDLDGRNEIVAGTSVFHPPEQPGGLWRRDDLAEGFRKTRIAVGDLTGNGQPDLVISEGEQCPARVAWVSMPDRQIHMLRDDLFHPHSLAIADFNGDGVPDIFVAEMGLGRNPNPRWFVYVNRGDGEFEEVLIAEGIPTHEAKPADLTGNGLCDVVGKDYAERGRIDVLFNRTLD
ncbi:MAG: VCBS repeat-containing protein [Armatimonadetes bacterium]|nr:VCBS repeat-containing protein [Armatimonadota bacterium]